MNFVRKLGASFSTVNRWENDKAIPRIFALKLNNKFCIDYSILFDYKNPSVIEKDQSAGME